MSWYERLIVPFAGSRPGAWLYVHVLTHVDRLLLRLTGGWLSTARGTHYHPSVVLLTTTGAKTGRPRTVPLLGFLSGDDVVLIASKGGAPRHPSWYWNLRAHPQAAVTLGGRVSPRLAREAEGPEREALWPRIVQFYPGYADYQARTKRTIPVMIIAPPGGRPRKAHDTAVP
jgi:deazaflavin-dependent oxidoreductase (nitroreductase family)